VRVVFLTHNYPRFAGDLPGAFLHPLAVALRVRGHDVRVVAPSDQGRNGREELDGVPVRRVRYAKAERERYAYTGQMADAVRSPLGLMALAGMIRALRQGAQAELTGAPDDSVVHAHWWLPAGLATPAPRRTVVTLHGTDARLLERSRPARWLGGWALRRVGVVSAVSADIAGVVARRTGRTDAGSHVMPMPVALPGRPWTTGGGGAIIVARLTAQKRVDLALRAIARTPSGIPLTVVGDGPALGGLRDIAARLGLADRVRWMGAQTATEVANLLGRADVMLFTAVGEGLGLAAVEALMAGVPVVVCRDGGGVVETVTQWGGGTVVEPTEEAVGAALAQALQSAELKAAAQSAGSKWRERLDPARVAETFERWYHEALDSGRS
jgi:glycosyltransferase involved in cell wall biosynthesis